MNTDTQALLHLHSYLTMGFIQHPLFRTITDKWGGGELELLSCLIDVTPYLQEKYDEHDDHPGVFLYEVAEPAGAALADWMAVNSDDQSARFPDPSEWTPIMDSLCHEFFRDLPPDHVPVYTIDHADDHNTLHEGIDRLWAYNLFRHYRHERNLNVVLKQDGVEI